MMKYILLLLALLTIGIILGQFIGPNSYLTNGGIQERKEPVPFFSEEESSEQMVPSPERTRSKSPPLVDESPSVAFEWWKDEEFVQKAAQAYPQFLDEVNSEVDSYRQKSTGRESLARVLSRGSSLFNSDEFPISIDEFQISEPLKWVDMANSLSTIAANRSRIGPSIFTLDEEKMMSLTRSMKQRPLNYPPYLLLELFTGSRRVDKNVNFTAEAKALYLDYLPRLDDARRITGNGSSAATKTLRALGRSNEEIVASLSHWSAISAEIIIGKEEERAILQDFMIDFESLANRYYY